MGIRFTPEQWAIVRRSRLTVRDARKAQKEAYTPSPFSTVQRHELKRIERHVRSIAAYMLGLHIAVFVLAVVVGVLAAQVEWRWPL